MTTPVLVDTITDAANVAAFADGACAVRKSVIAEWATAAMDKFQQP